MQQLDPSTIVETGVLDLRLVDHRGSERTLTELKGKVILLDFHTFTLPDSPQRILLLRELYNKYHARGLEIYQVSLDADEHFWRQMTLQLPWVCVRDAEGASASMYNVQTVPEFFLIDRDNQLQKRSSQMKDVEAEINALL
jgi:peroxiredoxin